MYSRIFLGPSFSRFISYQSMLLLHAAIAILLTQPSFLSSFFLFVLFCYVLYHFFTLIHFINSFFLPSSFLNLFISFLRPLLSLTPSFPSFFPSFLHSFLHSSFFSKGFLFSLLPQSAFLLSFVFLSPSFFFRTSLILTLFYYSFVFLFSSFVSVFTDSPASTN